MPYPIVLPNPLSQSNPFIAGFNGDGPTWNDFPYRAKDIEQIIANLNIIDGLGDENQALLVYQTISGTVGIYDPSTAFDAPTRAAMRASLIAELYGADPAAQNPCLAWVGCAGGMPGYTEEASWCCFCLGGTGSAQDNMTSGEFPTSSSIFAAMTLYWVNAWESCIDNGVIPDGASWISQSTGPADPPWGYFLGYGFDVVDDTMAIATAGAQLLTYLQGYNANTEEFGTAPP